MARKQEPSVGMMESLSEFKDLKNIDKETMTHVLEDAFRNVLSKMFGTDENCDVIISVDTGDFEIYRTREVVPDGEVQNPVKEISFTEASKMTSEDIEVGEEFTEKVDFASFGRRAILNLRQALASKILDLQNENVCKAFRARVGELISAEVYQVWKREALLLDQDNYELILPKSEQIPSDRFRKGDTVHAVIERVDFENNKPKIILSRTSGNFLMRLFDLNVPEIADGLITIRAVARIPGERAKMAVESYDERIDPVGACVGMNGSRIRGIVKELKGENIDVTTFTTNKRLMIQRALSPAKVTKIAIFEEEGRAEVYLRPEEVPLAIGRNASNIKLASSLSGFQIEVFRDIDDFDEEDIYLDEFSDEIEPWVIEQLKQVGWLTAKNVLSQSVEEIVQRADLEEKTVQYVLDVLRSEFEPESEAESESYSEQPADTAQSEKLMPAENLEEDLQEIDNEEEQDKE